MARMEERGDDSTFGTGGVGCRVERLSRSYGFRTELRRRTATDDDGGLQTDTDSDEMLFDSVG